MRSCRYEWRESFLRQIARADDPEPASRFSELLHSELHLVDEVIARLRLLRLGVVRGAVRLHRRVGVNAGVQMRDEDLRLQRPEDASARRGTGRSRC